MPFIGFVALLCTLTIKLNPTNKKQVVDQLHAHFCMWYIYAEMIFPQNASNQTSNQNCYKNRCTCHINNIASVTCHVFGWRLLVTLCMSVCTLNTHTIFVRILTDPNAFCLFNVSYFCLNPNYPNVLTGQALPDPSILVRTFCSHKILNTHTHTGHIV